MDLLLVAGLWLRSSIWSAVADELERLGHHPIPVELPGVDDGSTAASLEDQLAAVLAAVDDADRPVVVGHSAACGLAWMTADRRAETIAGLLLVGGFPPIDGEPYADLFPVTDGVMPFPGWAPFAGPDSDDLSEGQRDSIAAGAVPVPEGVATGIVRLRNEQRFDVPVVLICPEYDPDQARAWIDAGHLPELAQADRVSFVDIDSGHWPMVSRPIELARIIDAATREV